MGYKGTASTIPESPSELSIAADDPLARYMNRDYWQQRKSQNKVGLAMIYDALWFELKIILFAG